jgi:hypothetical protein
MAGGENNWREKRRQLACEERNETEAKAKISGAEK